MLFFMDLSGDVLRIDADKIYQGTNDLPKLQLVTPITPNNTAIQVAFTLPNGITTVYYPMAVMGSYTLGDLVHSELIDAPNVTQVYLWQITMPENVTLKNGTVIITFKVLKPTSVVTVDDEHPFPEHGQTDTYYVYDGKYYTWVETEPALYAPINTIAYEDTGASTTPIGKVAVQKITSQQSDNVQKAQETKIVGDDTIRYTQTVEVYSGGATLILPYIPNEESITAVTTWNGEQVNLQFTYNSTTNAVFVNGMPNAVVTATVSYSLSATEQTVNATLYFKKSDCVLLDGYYSETSDTLTVVGGAYKTVTTSPVPFTVTYAALPLPPESASEDQVDQLINLLNLYYTQNAESIVKIKQKMLNFYSGEIEESDWEHVGVRYFYTISYSTHGLANPFVAKYDVQKGTKYSNAFYSYEILPNGDITFTSDLAVDVKYTIMGKE